MVQRAVDDIILQEKEKLCVEYETYENIYGEVDEYELYELDKKVLDENNYISVHLKSKSKINMIWKGQMVWIVSINTK